MQPENNILAPIAGLIVPDADQMTSRAETALRFVRGFLVDSAETYQLAADELKNVKARAAAIEKQCRSITDPLNQAVKSVNDLFRGPSTFLADAEKLLKQKMLGWTKEQERIASEERRKDEEAAAVERRRIEDEARKKQAEAETAAKEAAQTGDVLTAARAAEYSSEAAALRRTAQITTAAPVTVATPNIAGISKSETWDFELIDLPLLIKHVAAHPELSNLLTIDSVAVRGYVRSLKANANLPGVRVFSKQVLRA